MILSSKHSGMHRARLTRGTALAAAFLLCLLQTASAQQVRAGRLNNFAGRLAAFTHAAAEQGHTGWFGSPYARPGTAVQVTFGARYAGITLIAPAAFGTPHLLELSQALASRMGYLHADYLLRADRRISSVDIDLSRSLRRDWRSASFHLDLSRLSDGLNALPLPRPVMIGVSPSRASKIVLATAASRIPIRDYWFISPEEVPAGTTVAFNAEISVAGEVVLAADALLLLVMLFLLAGTARVMEARFTRALQRQKSGATEVSAGQKKTFMAWCMATGMIVGITIAVIVLGGAIPPGQMAYALLVPGGYPTVAGVTALALVAVLLIDSVICWRSLLLRHNQDPSRMVPALLRLMWHLLAWIFLGIFSPITLSGIPAYTPLQLAALQAAPFWILCFIVVPAILWDVLVYIRCIQTPLTRGPLYDMVQEVALRAQTPVRHVFLITGDSPVVRTTPLGSLWISSQLAEALEPAEMRVILACAIGHLKYRHAQWITAAFVTANLLYGIVFTALVARWALQVTGAEPGQASDPTSGLITVNVCVMGVLMATDRRRAGRAEEFAMDLTGDADQVLNALNHQHSLNPAAKKPTGSPAGR